VFIIAASALTIGSAGEGVEVAKELKLCDRAMAEVPKLRGFWGRNSPPKGGPLRGAALHKKGDIVTVAAVREAQAR